ncbi:MAG: DUF4435 domain-containing protein [Chloroflexi bacterium]|nr:DUF4435 domain-containing protein [Chloroflexota bacterium]
MVRILWNEMVNEYRLARASIKGKSFVMVEGRTDRALWTEFIPDQFAYLVYADGKTDIVDAMNTPVMRGIEGVAGIVDADYWLITDADELGTENLLYDAHCPDLESLLLCSPALKKVLRNHLYNYNVDEIHAFADRLACNAQRLAAEFGYFRLLNHLEDYGIRFRDFDVSEVIDPDALRLDRARTAKRLAQTTAAVSCEDLLRQVDALRKSYPPENPQICRGKDVVAILAYLLPLRFRAEFGDALPQNVTVALNGRALSIGLRSAYDSAYFKETSLFNCIQSWESTNTPYKILKPEI